MTTLDKTMQELTKLLNIISDQIDYNQGWTEEGLRSANCHILSVDHYHNYQKEQVNIKLAKLEEEIKDQNDKIRLELKILHKVIQRLDERILELEGANDPENYVTKTQTVSER